jgi:hypothetical protein
VCRLSKIIIIIFLITVVIFVTYSNFIANNTEKETVAISKPIITVLPTATFSNEEVEIIAQTLAGECYDDKLSDKRNVAEVIVNRVSDGGFGRNVIEIVTAPGQFRGYWYQSRPVSKSDIQIAEETLNDWYANDCKALSEYLFFCAGSNRENVFRSEY